MISKHSFTCARCQKHFEITGYWYNQMLMEWWLDFKFLRHCIAHHPRKYKKNALVYFIKTITSLPVLLIMQILDIIAISLRNL